MNDTPQSNQQPPRQRKVWTAPVLERAVIAERTNKKSTFPTDGFTPSVHQVGGS